VKQIVVFLTFVFLLLQSTYAQVLNPEQKEVVQFIEKIYAVSYKHLEFGEFNGKIDLKKFCELLRLFVTKETLIVKIRTSEAGIIRQTCEEGYGSRFPRYPASDDDALDAGDVPIPQIQTPIVNGNFAEVKVILLEKNRDFRIGRALYYLKKLPEGWRIYKVRMDSSYPKDDDPMVDAKRPSFERIKFKYYPDDAKPEATR
jgi:hypothetical protein